MKAGNHLDSVNFVLGAKADRTTIHGETECMVKAEFSVPEGAKRQELRGYR
ncbi:MAG: hypothetical protein ACLRSW_10030 [Christensenellaceae bacterium]